MRVAHLDIFAALLWVIRWGDWAVKSWCPGYLLEGSLFLDWKFILVQKVVA